MDAEEWRTGTNPRAMLGVLRDRKVGSDRKFRLLAVHCCRRLWGLLTDGRSRAAVEAAERYADGMVGLDECEAARRGAAEAATAVVRARRLTPGFPEIFVLAARAAAGVGGMPGVSGPDAAGTVVAVHSLVARYPASGLDRGTELVACCDIIRDLFGNPFSPPVGRPASQDPTVLALARGIHADRAWDLLPILADALQDAGHEDSRLLGHLRGPVAHAAGCWAVDLLLGKE